MPLGAWASKKITNYCPQAFSYTDGLVTSVSRVYDFN